MSSELANDTEDCNLRGMSPRDWRREQLKDRIITDVVKWIRTGNKPDKDFIQSPAFVALSRNFDNLKLKQGVLYRVTRTDDEQKETLH